MRVELNEADLTVLEQLDAEIEDYRARMDLVARHRNWFVVALLRKANAPRNLNYRLAPDRTALVPIEEQ